MIPCQPQQIHRKAFLTANPDLSIVCAGSPLFDHDRFRLTLLYGTHYSLPPIIRVRQSIHVFFCVHLCGTHISSFLYYQLYLNGCKWLFVQALVTELSEKLLIRKFISLMSYSANRSPYFARYRLKKTTYRKNKGFFFTRV